MASGKKRAGAKPRGPGDRPAETFLTVHLAGSEAFRTGSVRALADTIEARLEAKAREADQAAFSTPGLGGLGREERRRRLFG